ncbi:MAG TPA: hypothetical protein VEI97_08095 [bacterium]|nr:hypothetical protein [bacterium]
MPTVIRPCIDRHPELQPDTCAVCRGFTPAGWRGHSAGPAARRDLLPSRRFDPCPHLGPKAGGQPCGTDLYECRYDGTLCSKSRACDRTVRVCETCPHHPAAAGPLVPVRDVIVDRTRLVPNPQQMNNSVLPYKGRLLMAYRTGWSGSRVHVCELDPATYTPGPSTTLDLRHRFAVGGREDPRLFAHDGRLHLAYVGVRQTGPKAVVARQLFAVLNDDLTVEREWEPQYGLSTSWEKNWSPFSHGGKLYAVYSLRPWVVLELRDDESTAAVGDHHKGLPWSHGLPRGGAPPVLHDGEWYCWFHGTDKRKSPALYTVGVCTFEADPPFRPLRCTRAPVLRPDLTLRQPDGSEAGQWYAATQFPCGAYFEAGRWVVSMGRNDHWCAVSEFDAAQVEGRLAPV